MPPKRVLLLTCAAAALTLTMRSSSDATGTAEVWMPPASSLAVAADPLGTAPQPPSGPAAGPGPAEKDSSVDVSALRYFAAQKNAVRVEAELRLLRKLHPDFRPPEDLYGDGQGSGDEQPLWDLYAKRDFAGLRSRMEDLRRADASWHASSDLASKLALAEGRDALVKASDEKRWPDAVGIATANKGLLTCQDPDALWRTAEALVQTGDEARGLAAYRYIIATCDAAPIRAATIDKAAATLRSLEALDQLLALGRRLPGGHGEFDEARLNRVRRLVGEAASGSSTLEPSSDDIDRLSKAADLSSDGSDLQLLGWFSYARSDFPSAQRWFRAALKVNRDSKTAEGLVLSLRSASDNAGARQAAIELAPLGELNRKLMMEVLTASLTEPGARPLNPEEMTALTQAVTEYKYQDGAQSLLIYLKNKKDEASSKAWHRSFIQWKGEEIEGRRSAEGAEALGWLLYQGNDVAGAEAWFRKSLDWSPSEAAAVGLVVASHRLHHDKDCAKWLAQYSSAYSQVAQVGKSMQYRGAPARVARIVKHLTHVAQAGVRPSKVQVMQGADWDQDATSIVNAAQSGNYDQAFAMLERRRSRRPEPRGLSVVRGWVLYHRGQWDEAKQVFSGLDSGRFSMERQEGLRMIQQAYTPPRMR